MAKETCSNCYIKLSGAVSFCPGCSRPTPHASEPELVDWELSQWRRHVERTIAEGSAGGTATATRVFVAPARDAAPDLGIVTRPQATAAAEPPSGRSSRVRRLSKPRLPRLPKTLDKPARSEPEDRVIVLDADNPFAYTACTSCERADWIVRTTRNEDETRNYWCIRCSRSFKSDAKIRFAFKPFVTAGSIVGALATLSVVMR